MNLEESEIKRLIEEGNKRAYKARLEQYKTTVNPELVKKEAKEAIYLLLTVFSKICLRPGGL